VVGGPPLGLLVALAYFAPCDLERRTIGGIVLNLKVSASMISRDLRRGARARTGSGVLGDRDVFGFLWMVWDKDHQTWHDKIAGTPSFVAPWTSLVCL
jgi:uncharacterized RDD family membrane protein YckC